MNELGYVSPEEVRQALRQAYRHDSETNLKTALARSLADGLKPVDEKGRWKPNPLLALVGILLCALIGVFFYFSVGARS